MEKTIQPLRFLQQKIGRILPESTLNELAMESGFMKRKARKLTPFHLVLSFFLCLGQRFISLSHWAAQVATLCGQVLSKQGLAKRLGAPATKFVNQLMSFLIKAH